MSRHRTTAMIWFFFVLMPGMYGLECQVCYGWGEARWFLVPAFCFAVLGVILEIRRAAQIAEATPEGEMK